MRVAPYLVWLALLLVPSLVQAQATTQEAREEGRAFARDKRADPTLVPDDEAQAQIVPGYQGPVVAQSTYFDDPERLVADGTAAATGHEGYQTATDGERRRPSFSATEIKGATARATVIETDPSVFLAGESIEARTGACTPLPPGSGSNGFYEATCNSGAQLEEATPICRTPLMIDVEREERWRYMCETLFERTRRNGDKLCTPFADQIETGSCRETGRRTVGMTCLQWDLLGCVEPGEPIEELTLSCAQQIPGQAGARVVEGRIVAERRDETACEAATASMTCALRSETCVDSAPETRTIEGVDVARSCWGWERHYACQRTSEASDCGALKANGQCTHLRDECLDPEPAGTCRVSESVYRCPVPGTPGADTRQYICGNDVYCINGDCEPIVREASTEFRDALVALHAIDQAGGEFNPDTLTVFSGSRETCHKPVFGLINCCAGKVSGLLTAGAGLGALAGGPAAIAAVATPFLTLFACSTSEKMLDIKDRMGFCHRVGGYCSSSILGFCKTRRTAYCCFESKLSRILQEQGRPQIDKPWGLPRYETCQGFSIDEFARLDLSRMDFTEVYAEFVDAARLPDEVQTINDIQTRIRAYYELHEPPRGG